MTQLTEYYRAIRRESSLIAYWRMGGSDLAGTRAIDFAGKYGLNGIYNGLPVSRSAQISAVGNEIGSFSPGSKEYGSEGQNLEIPDSVPLRVTGDITIEGWIIILKERFTGWIIGKPGEAEYIAAPYCIMLSEGKKILFAMGNGVSQAELYSAVTMPLSIPTYFAATSYRGKMKLYINGVLSESKAIGAQEIKDNKQPLYIGENGGNLGGSRFNFSGLCGEFALYNGALSATSIKEHFSIGRQIIYRKPYYTTYDLPSYS
jgi:hypothetical protein